MPTRWKIPNDKVRTRDVNRPLVGRELLAALGCELDVDPAALIALKDTVTDDWTLAGGATTEAATDRGTTEMASHVVLLDAQGESASFTRTGGAGGLPAGTYYLRVRCKDSAQVADDLGIKIQNTTDATAVLAEVTRTLTAAYAVLEVLFTVKAADAGDSLEFTFTKKTATANSIRMDYCTIVPVTVRGDGAWGTVPEGGRVEHTLTGGKVTEHKVYDAASGGNVVETGAYTYDATNTDQLNTLAMTREGRTLTETYTYDANGDLTSVKRTVT